MRSHYLLFLTYVLIIPSSSGEIRNGYKEITAVKQSFKGLKEMLLTDMSLSSSKKKSIKEHLHQLRNYIVYHDATDLLLNEFKLLAPDLYSQIQHVQDRKGRPVHVYVRFIPYHAETFQACGKTKIERSADDQDRYVSEYGPGTVSIEICMLSKALFVLAHEFGHVEYLVPNLNEYASFYQLHYAGRENFLKLSHIGHFHNDLSGRNAYRFEDKFRKSYRLHTKTYRTLSPSQALIRATTSMLTFKQKDRRKVLSASLFIR